MFKELTILFKLENKCKPKSVLYAATSKKGERVQVDLKKRTGKRISEEDQRRTTHLYLCRWQFHQYFTISFYIQKCFVQLLCAYVFWFASFRKKEISAKAACNVLVTLTNCVNLSLIFYSQLLRT